MIFCPITLCYMLTCLFRRKKIKTTLGLTIYNTGKQIHDFLSSHLPKFAFHQDMSVLRKSREPNISQ